MKKLMLLMVLTTATSVSAADHKHPSDKCPKGSHTVERETKTEIRGEVSASGGRGIARGGGKLGGNRTTTERTKVCRDNKGSGIRERGSKK